MPFSRELRQQTPLRELAATPDYFARVGEAVLGLDESLDLAGVMEAMESAARRIGADVATFVSFVRDDASCQSYRFLLACDPQWCTDYEQQARYGDDPWLAYARSHAEPTVGAKIAADTDAQRSVLRMAADYGFTSALIVPGPAASGLTRLGVLCLGSWTPGFFEDEGLAAAKIAARPLAAALHEWWLARIRRELIEATPITPVELRLLDYERRGFSTKRIALVTGWSTSSVDSRFRRLIAKLGVVDRRSAARLAAEYGLL